MDIKRMSRGDWVVVAGFLALFMGTSLSWYAVVERYSEGTMSYGVSGWAYAAGWLSWLAGLAAVIIIVLSSGVIPQLHVDLRLRVPLIVMGLGAAALLLVLVGLVTKPSYAGLVVYLQSHPTSGLIAKAEKSSDWSNEVDSSALGVGIFFSLLGAAAVAGGGFLKLGEPAGTAAPLPASDVVSNAVQTARVALVAARAAVKTQGSSPLGAAAAHATKAPSAASAATGGAPPGFCTKCGVQFRSADARFCPVCGTGRAPK